MTTMVRVTIRLPAGLFRRFQHHASEFLSDALGDYATRLDLLAACVAVEAQLVGSLCAPPQSDEPKMACYVSVPEFFADAVRKLGRAASLTPEQAWHRAVHDFCERSQSLWLEAPAVRREAA